MNHPAELRDGQRFIVVGRAGMDLYPEPAGTKIADAEGFSAMLGGSAANIAAGLARLGARVGLMSALSDDPVGRYCARQLSRYGIDQSLVGRSAPGTRTSLALSESRLEDHETVIYRNGAADFDLSPELLDRLKLEGVSALVVTGTALAAPASREVVMGAIERATAAGVDVVLDLDYRPYSWANGGEASAAYLAASRASRIVVGNGEEFAVLHSAASPDPAHARALLGQGPDICIYKMGQEGAITFEGGEEMATGIYPVEALKPVGAGDAFLASFLVAYYGGTDTCGSVLRGSAAASLVVSRKGCAGAMPTGSEVAEFMAAREVSAGQTCIAG